MSSEEPTEGCVRSGVVPWTVCPKEPLSPPTTINNQISFVEGGSGGYLASVKSPPAGNLGKFN